MFSCEFWENFKSTFLIEYLRLTHLYATKTENKTQNNQVDLVSPLLCKSVPILTRIVIIAGKNIGGKSTSRHLPAQS